MAFFCTKFFIKFIFETRLCEGLKALLFLKSLGIKEDYTFVKLEIPSFSLSLVPSEIEGNKIFEDLFEYKSNVVLDLNIWDSLKKEDIEDFFLNGDHCLQIILKKDIFRLLELARKPISKADSLKIQARIVEENIQKIISEKEDKIESLEVNIARLSKENEDLKEKLKSFKFWDSYLKNLEE